MSKFDRATQDRLLNYRDQLLAGSPDLDYLESVLKELKSAIDGENQLFRKNTRWELVLDGQKAPIELWADTNGIRHASDEECAEWDRTQVPPHIAYLESIVWSPTRKQLVVANPDPEGSKDILCALMNEILDILDAKAKRTKAKRPRGSRHRRSRASRRQGPR